MKFYKVLNSELKSNHSYKQFKYARRTVVDNIPWKREFNSDGGIYFSEMKDIFRWVMDASEMIVEVSPFGEIIIDEYKRKAHGVKVVSSPINVVSFLCEHLWDIIPYHGAALRWLPDELKTRELYLAAVIQDGWALLWGPKALRTKEIYAVAVEQNPWLFEHVPNEFKTREMCVRVVARHGWCVKWVPDYFLTEEMCIDAVSQDAWTISRGAWILPARFRTMRVYISAVTQNGLVLPWVPDNLMTEELCLLAVTQNGMALQWVPESLKTVAVCRAAVRQNNRAILSVPKHLRSAIL